eukprot:58114_1
MQNSNNNTPLGYPTINGGNPHQVVPSNSFNITPTTKDTPRDTPTETRFGKKSKSGRRRTYSVKVFNEDSDEEEEQQNEYQKARRSRTSKSKSKPKQKQKQMRVSITTSEMQRLDKSPKSINNDEYKQGDIVNVLSNEWYKSIITDIIGYNVTIRYLEGPDQNEEDIININEHPNWITICNDISDDDEYEEK